MKLIDAEPLIKFCTYCADDVTVKIDRNTMAKMLADAPEIDAVPVVRCKECKHSEHWYGDKARCFLWCETGIDVFENGFCSYGERKDDELQTD